MSYFIWKKGEKIQLSKNFDSSEFDCQCKYADCIEQKASMVLIETLQKVREEVNFPLDVTSGFRCAKHQADLRKNPKFQTAKGKSSHELGDAADLRPVTNTPVHFSEMEIALNETFEAVGEARPKFIHVDTRNMGTGIKIRWHYA
jgi:uncharacterized protein YcbK (DUF882 family)